MRRFLPYEIIYLLLLLYSDSNNFGYKTTVLTLPSSSCQRSRSVRSMLRRAKVRISGSGRTKKFSHVFSLIVETPTVWYTTHPLGRLSVRLLTNKLNRFCEIRKLRWWNWAQIYDDFHIILQITIGTKRNPKMLKSNQNKFRIFQLFKQTFGNIIQELQKRKCTN